MFRKLIAVAALSGTLAIGAAGVASATTTTSPSTPSGTTHTVDCTKALARVPKIKALEAKAAAYVPKAQARQAKATAAGHTKWAARIGKRITRVHKLEARGTKILARISAACGSASSAG